MLVHYPYTNSSIDQLRPTHRIIRLKEALLSCPEDYSDETAILAKQTYDETQGQSISFPGMISSIHLVNNSGHFGVSFYPPINMSGLWVDILYDKSLVSVRSLVTGNEYSYTLEKNRLRIEVPQLSLFDAIEIR